ncbi:Hypothetical predicted protein [Mytilus galloprovincialis]|uniref:Uncharacterized protein n=1 Tax=Mytilus galloprovincialis TaxID=29158 RepID=A0A8B6BLZ0_MYTGA|nr:Hypothetical predicted protein [Mytilus galloprovincialis]
MNSIKNLGKEESTKRKSMTKFLSSTPSALFEPSGLMRQAQKATLTDAVCNIGNCAVSRKLDFELHYVIDVKHFIARQPDVDGNIRQVHILEVAGQFFHIMYKPYHLSYIGLKTRTLV